MTDDDLADRLAAIERRLDAAYPEPEDRVDPERVESLAERVADLEAAVEAVEGYVGHVERVDDDLERRADAALAAVDDLQARVATLEGGERAPGAVDTGETGAERSGGEFDDGDGDPTAAPGDPTASHGDSAAPGDRTGPHGGRAALHGESAAFQGESDALHGELDAPDGEFAAGSAERAVRADGRPAAERDADAPVRRSPPSAGSPDARPPADPADPPDSPSGAPSAAAPADRAGGDRARCPNCTSPAGAGERANARGETTRRDRRHSGWDDPSEPDAGWDDTDQVDSGWDDTADPDSGWSDPDAIDSDRHDPCASDGAGWTGDESPTATRSQHTDDLDTWTDRVDESPRTDVGARQDDDPPGETLFERLRRML